MFRGDAGVVPLETRPTSLIEVIEEVWAKTI